jgi:hypothetical protein
MFWCDCEGMVCGRGGQLYWLLELHFIRQVCARAMYPMLIGFD